MRQKATNNVHRVANPFNEDYAIQDPRETGDYELHSTHSTRTQTPDGVSTALRPRSSASTVKRKFRSYTLREPYEKPWLADSNFNKTRVNNWIVLAFVFLGCVGAGEYTSPHSLHGIALD